MDKTIYTDINMDGAAAGVNSMLGDPDMDSSTAEALAMVYIDGKRTSNKLTDVLATELGNIKSNLREQDEAILEINKKANANSSNIGKQGKQITEQGEQIKALAALVESSASGTSSNQHLFATDLGARVLQCLPVGFDGRSGCTMWVPVHENDHDYVVLSKSIAEQSIKCMVSTNDDLKPIFDSLKPAVAFAHNTGADTGKSTLFMNIMKKTCFGVRRLASNKWTKNFDLYKVMDADYFKALMQEVATMYPSRPLELPESVKTLKIHPRYLPNTISLDSGVGKNAKYVNMGETLTPDDLSRMPSWGTNWWCEAYASGADRYFGMEEVDGKLGHVQSGVYVPPEGNMYARNYEVTLEVYTKQLTAAGAKKAGANKKSNKRARAS